MYNKIIYITSGIVIGVIAATLYNYILNFYDIDSGATANWGLLIVAIFALLFAYQQILENRKLKKVEVDHARKLQRLEVTQAYLSDIRRMVVEGTLNSAIKKVKQTVSEKKVTYDEDIQFIIYFFEELGIMYRENMVDRKLVRDMSAILISRVYDEFNTFLEAFKKASRDDNPVKNWEYLVKQIKNNE
jgi:hypothetical protein